MAQATAAERARITRLVTANVGMALAACEPHLGRGLDADDLAQSAMLGLVKAANRWREDDPSGAKFGTYASWWVRNEIQEALRGKGVVKMGIAAARRSEAWPSVRSIDRIGPVVDPGSVEDRDARCDRIEAALATLPDAERRALDLRYGLTGRDQMKLREVGRRLGISTAAAAVRVARGLQLLRAELESKPDGGPHLRLAMA